MSQEDKLMKQLWKQERVDRWGLYSQFRQEANAYQERMSAVNNGGYYHDLSTDTLTASAVVIDHNSPSHESYVYLSLFESYDDDRGAKFRSTRSYAIGRVRYAIRWRLLNETIFNEGDADNEFRSYTIDSGPSSNVGRRLLLGGRQSEAEWRRRLYQYHSFAPETRWHPEDGEQIRVREVLNQAIGEIMVLGYEQDTQPLTPEIQTIHGIR